MPDAATNLGTRSSRRPVGWDFWLDRAGIAGGPGHSSLQVYIGPRVRVRAGDGVIACFGANTFAVRGVLAGELRMTWDPEARRWWRAHSAGPGESEKAVRGIRRALEPHGVGVEQLRPGPPAAAEAAPPYPEGDALHSPPPPPPPPLPPSPPPPWAGPNVAEGQAGPDLELAHSPAGGGATEPPPPPSATPVVGRNRDGSECGFCLRLRARLGAGSAGCRRHSPAAAAAAPPPPPLPPA